MSLPIISQPTNNTNNPTKEIWSSSGNIFDNSKYSDRPFANDAPGLISNININTTSTTTTTLPPSNLIKNIPPFPSADLTNHNYYIDDMLVFNKYIHYSQKIGQNVITFDPESFLEQTTKTFNIYSLENR